MNPEGHPWFTRITLGSTITKPTATRRTGRGRQHVGTGWGTDDRRSLAGFLSPFSSDAHAVMEAIRNWTVMFDWRNEIVDEVGLAHPLKVKAIAEAKIKTDKIDATILAHLLRAELVPSAHAPSQRARELRPELRERMFYVRLRTMIKNRVVTVFDRYPENTAALRRCTDLFGAAGRKQLAALERRRPTGCRSTAALP